MKTEQDGPQESGTFDGHTESSDKYAKMTLLQIGLQVAASCYPAGAGWSPLLFSSLQFSWGGDLLALALHLHSYIHCGTILSDGFSNTHSREMLIIVSYFCKTNTQRFVFLRGHSFQRV